MALFNRGKTTKEEATKVDEKQAKPASADVSPIEDLTDLGELGELTKSLEAELEKQRKKRLQVKAIMRISYQSRTIEAGQSFKLVSYGHFNPAQMEWDDDLEDKKIKSIVNKINRINQKHADFFNQPEQEG